MAVVGSFTYVSIVTRIIPSTTQHAVSIRKERGKVVTIKTRVKEREREKPRKVDGNETLKKAARWRLQSLRLR